jgi:DNA segregation ATPase FtsK/SpoIIIE-like protein
MLRVAAPYFGDTTSGLQMFNDARAQVTLGELIVLPDEPEAPAP